MTQAKEGSQVKLHFLFSTEDGFTISSEEYGDPLEFVLGEGTMLPSIEKQIIGMKPNDSKEFDISEEESFPYMEDLVVEVKREMFPEDKEIEVGSQIELEQEDGTNLLAVITEMDEENVTLDLNHPLAQEALKVKINLLEVK